jgi:hypothetical protein
MRAKKVPCDPLYYAKQGIITPEMEYIAIRETKNMNKLNLKQKQCNANIKEIVSATLPLLLREGWCGANYSRICS